MFVNQVLFRYENVASEVFLTFRMLECWSLHFNRKIAKSLTKQSNSGLQSHVNNQNFGSFRKC